MLPHSELNATEFVCGEALSEASEITLPHWAQENEHIGMLKNNLQASYFRLPIDNPRSQGPQMKHQARNAMNKVKTHFPVWAQAGADVRSVYAMPRYPCSCVERLRVIYALALE